MTLNQAISLASNIVGKNQTIYTKEMFMSDFPSFSKLVKEEGHEDRIESIVPEGMLEQFIAMANDAIQEGRWFHKWRYAMGLYIAHYSTLYLQTLVEPTEDSSKESAVGSGTVIGNVASASQGDQSISYDNNALTQGNERFGNWNKTTFGQMLATEAKLVGIGGSWII